MQSAGLPSNMCILTGFSTVWAKFESPDIMLRGVTFTPGTGTEGGWSHRLVRSARRRGDRPARRAFH